MLESEFKITAINKIRSRFAYLDLDIVDIRSGDRSMPDTLILGPQVWAALEFKRSEAAPRQPNQEYHIDRLSAKSYATFVYPENVEEVLDELEELFTS